MDDLDTDNLCSSGNDLNLDKPDLYDAKEQEKPSTVNGLNTSEELDPLDLIENCERVSVGSNSGDDVWNASDSEEESFENKSQQPTTNVSSFNGNASLLCRDVSKERPKTDLQEKITNEIDLEAKEIVSEQETPREDVEKGEDEQKISENVVESEESRKGVTENVVKSKEISEEKETNDEEVKANEVQSEEKQVTVDDKTPHPTADNEESLEEKTKATETRNSEVLEKENAATENPEDDSSDVVVGENKDPLADPIQQNKPAEADMQIDFEEAIDASIDAIDYEMDDDFDPSLLCPEVSMDVDDSPVITNNASVPQDGSTSPLPYEAVFSTFVDETTGAEVSFNLTDEEQELRKRLYGPTNPIESCRIHCTACNVHLGSALQGQTNRFVHPMLKVLICKECYNFYTSGEFEKDADGSELYCRWCGQGGKVLCCSKCEYVFCQRCIKNNFGRKKMCEIRDSDNWECYRCTPSQIITQRIACYEFFEYTRREMGRAATLNDPEYWAQDHTHCCSKVPKKRSAGHAENQPKPKRRKVVKDPDFDPLQLKPEKKVIEKAPVVQKTIPFLKNMLPNPISFLPKPQSTQNDDDIEFVRAIPAPQVVLNPIRSQSGYRTILPNPVRAGMQPPTLMRANNAQDVPLPPLVPTNASRLLSALSQHRNVNNSQGGMMKHEWFEKTVRAAARVNSQLSFTLTQLNKAQAQASSVEELAVVHNKLQEILSSSINSLIQIRKNLRTEFITGIKTVRLPSKKSVSFINTPATIPGGDISNNNNNNDDDVIIVSAPNGMPMPSTSQQSATFMKNPILVVGGRPLSGITLTNGNENRSPLPSRGYIKVKSVKDLQNVPSECITIPDDPPSPKKETYTIVGSDILSHLKDIQSNRVKPPETPKTNNESQNSNLGSDILKIRIKSVVKVNDTHSEPPPDGNKIKETLCNVPISEFNIKYMQSCKVNLEKVDLESLQKRLTAMNACK